MASLGRMERYQYATVFIGGRQDVAEVKRRLGITLSYFGQRGYELVFFIEKGSNWAAGVENGFLVFKRYVPDGSEADGPWSMVWDMRQVVEAYEGGASLD